MRATNSAAGKLLTHTLTNLAAGGAKSPGTSGPLRYLKEDHAPEYKAAIEGRRLSLSVKKRKKRVPSRPVVDFFFFF